MKKKKNVYDISGRGSSAPRTVRISDTGAKYFQADRHGRVDTISFVTARRELFELNNSGRTIYFVLFFNV